MAKRLLAAGLVLAAVAVAAGGEVRVLVASGTRAEDGQGIASFRQPALVAHNHVVFLGSTSALFRDDHGAVSRLVGTGEVLPAPLDGTFNEFTATAINAAGVVAFTATLNSPTTPSGIFRWDAGNVTILATSDDPPDINARGEVVFCSDARVQLVRAGDRASISVATPGDPLPGGGTYASCGRTPVVSDAGSVAFVGTWRATRRRETGVFLWDPAGGLRSLALEGAPSPMGGAPFGDFTRGSISISPTGAVAFVGSAGGLSHVFHFDPRTGVVRSVAQRGDVVGGLPLNAISERFVGTNSRGDVAFVGTLGGERNDLGLLVGGQRRLIVATAGALRAAAPDLDSAGSLAPRLTESGGVVWVRDGRVERYDGSATAVVSGADGVSRGFVAIAPDVNDAGVTVFAGSRDAVYRLERSGIETPARAGDDIPGLGPLAFLDSLAAERKTVTIGARLPDGRSALVAARRGRLVKIVATGDPAPDGGTLELDSTPPAVHGSKVLFPAVVLTSQTGEGGLFVTDARTARTVSVFRNGQAVPGGNAVFLEGFAWAGDDILVAAALDTQEATTGLFRRRGRRLVKVAATGDAVSGGTLAGVGIPSGNGRRVVFWADLAGNPLGVGLAESRNGRVRKLVLLPAGLSLGTDEFAGDPVPLRRSTAVFVGTETVGEATRTGLFVIRRRGVAPLVLEGDASPLGGTVLALVGETIGGAGREAVFAAELTGATAARALLATSANVP